MKRNIITSLKIAVLSLIFPLAACTDEVSNPTGGTPDADAITLSIKPESAMVSSRSGEYSDASLVNRIYYAIYKKDQKGEYILDPYYQPNGESFNERDYSEDVRNNFLIKLIPDPDAQPGTQYRIVCWAQYTKQEIKEGVISYVNDYYDLSSFPIISVNYGENGDIFDNNDEERDAFYASFDFTMDQTGTQLQVVLTRPFAQINVATSGWDFEGLATIEPNKKVVKYSSIQIIGAAKTLDILNNEAKAEDTPLTVTYDYALIPAYRHLAEVEGLDWLKVTGIYSKDHAEGDKEEKIEEGIFHSNNKNEEFLKLHLESKTKPDGLEDGQIYDNEGYAVYIGWERYNKYCSSSQNHDELIYNIFTETFKYLSMSYVLVPFEVSKNEKGEEVRSGSTVDVVFDCKVEKNDTKGVFENQKVLELKNVPASSNWRTNIIAADGSGFFMKSNELNVKIYSETFADYYKRLRANENNWNDVKDGDENGSDMDDGYEWPDEDLNPEDGKMPIILPGITNPQKSYLVDVEGKSVDFIKYLDNKITITIDPVAGFNRYKDVAKYFNIENLSYRFFLANNELTGDRVSRQDGKFVFKVDKSELEELKNYFSPVTIKLEEYETDYTQLSNVIRKDVPDLKYYPIEFRVKTDFGGVNNKFVSEDFVGTIKYYTSYKFTFSETSTDEGREIIDDINKKGILGVDDKTNGFDPKNLLYDEVNSKFLFEGKGAESKHITARSRDNTSAIKDANGKVTGYKPANNDKMYALKDHIRFRGACNYATGTNGHWITLNKVLENCKITVKIGRDEGVDNSSAVDDKTKTRTLHDRTLYYNWGQTPLKSIDTWKGWDPEKSNEEVYINYLDSNNKNTKTTYKNTESKILKSEVTSIDNFGEGKEIKIYVDMSGHSYYWIILSEPDND